MLISSFFSYFYGRSSPMMTICDIKLVNIRKCLSDCRNIPCFPDYPYSVTNAIRRSKIIFHILCFYFIYNGCDCCIITVCKKDRAGLCITDIHVTNTIHLLFCTGILMLFDHIILIIINGCACGNTSLSPPVHGQLIDIVTRFFISDKISLCYHIP